MTNLFNRAAVFTDLHFGKKNNERQFNTDCEEFVLWFIANAEQRKADCIIFMGDWHDNRHSIHISTLNYSMSNLERLDQLGIPVYFISGNHDLPYKEKREISSIAIGRNFKNLHIINDFYQVGNVTFCPWLVGDEWKKIPDLAKHSTYMFGHFELPHFQMNAMVEMPDHGGLNVSHFDGVGEWAFTGHFHKRQSRGKVCYTGNSFPHSFSDAWDDDRGMMILDWGQAPEFIKWQDAPNYRTLKLSELLESPDQYINDKTYAKITSDLDITFDECQLIKDIFQNHYSPRKLDVTPNSKQDEEQTFEEGTTFRSVEQIVIEGLKNIDSVSMDKNMLIEIFRGL